MQTRPRWSRNPRQFLADLLVGKVLKLKDVRYNLADVLQSKAVRDAFDVVIIDCPPRLTTSTAQALCAGSHLLILTILDKPCAEAVISFCEEVERLKKNDTCPALNYVGVVGVRVSHNVDEIAERDAKHMIADGLKQMNFPSGLLNERHFVRRSAAFLNNVFSALTRKYFGRLISDCCHDWRHRSGSPWCSCTRVAYGQSRASRVIKVPAILAAAIFAVLLLLVSQFVGL